MFSTEKLTFTFPENGITAVDGVSLQFKAGKIYGLLGENGAGKSTFARLCTGHLQPSEGRILYKGLPLHLCSAGGGIKNGLILTPQHPQLSGELTVWENLLIGLHTASDIPSGVLSPKKSCNAIAAALDRYNIKLPLTQKAGTLDSAQLHWAAIGEALLKKPAVFFLDEPSASFSPQEITQLYGILRRCADQGSCIVVVTHRIQEVLAFMDTVHILRNGKSVKSRPVDSAMSAKELLQDIFGSEQIEENSALNSAGTAASAAVRYTGSSKSPFQHGGAHKSFFQYSSAKTASAASFLQTAGLEISHISAVNSKGVRFSDFSLTAPCGRITGVVGIKKQGLELLEYLLVNTLKPEHGTIRFNEQLITRIPRTAYAYIPSKRMRNGIADQHSIAENLYVRARSLLYRYGIYSKTAVNAWKRTCSFDIPRSWDDPVLSLSGGMIQRLIFNRELDNPAPQLVICAEPYWGLDRKIQLILLQKLRRLAAEGAAIIVLTSDADAALETCDCIHVLYHGAVTCFMERAAYDRSQLIAAMMQSAFMSKAENASTFGSHNQVR